MILYKLSKIKRYYYKKSILYFINKRDFNKNIKL